MMGSQKQNPNHFIQAKPFYSLLNIGDMIEQSGRMQNFWEAENERYIQNVKRDISTMNHNERYLKTILKKMLTTNVLD